MRTFTAYIQFDPDSNLYVGIIPGIPGAHTQNATLDELHNNLREVLELSLEEFKGRIEDLPRFVGLQQLDVVICLDFLLMVPRGWRRFCSILDSNECAKREAMFFIDTPTEERRPFPTIHPEISHDPSSKKFFAKSNCPQKNSPRNFRGCSR